jgi:hypothetical protein
MPTAAFIQFLTGSMLVTLTHGQIGIGGVPGFGGFNPGTGFGGPKQIGKSEPESCCKPADNLMWQNNEGAMEDREPWIEEVCTCLVDDDTITGALTAGSYAHYHYVLDDYKMVDPRQEKTGLKAHMDGGGNYYDVEGHVTFHLQPCDGKSNLFVKPALLAEGRDMDQVTMI